MKRVWVVDDKIPVHLVYGGGAPLPLRFEAEVVRYLVEQVSGDQWEEPPVLELCRALCGEDFEATFFLTPEQMLRALDQGATPPHAVIFDWEYPGSTDERNRAAIDRLLRGSFVYVQVYTHLGHDAVEPKVSDLRERFRGRLLVTKGKADVTPVQLRDDIRQAWTGTIAGDLADSVRREAFAAVERALIDIGGVHRNALAAMAQGAAENLLHLVLAKVRDEIGGPGFEVLNAVFGGSYSAESNPDVRRLLSVWYYYFPADDQVRRGDLIELGGNGDLGLVLTPPCDLVSFPKKTGRRLTWLRTVRLDADGVKALQTAGIKIDDIGGSIIAGHGAAGDTVILLPNVPLKPGNRDGLADYAVLCHAWDNRLCKAAPGGSLLYEDIKPFFRRCTLADPFASGVIAKIMAVMSSPGTPDLPKGERARLKTALAPPPAAPAATPPAAAPTMTPMTRIGCASEISSPQVRAMFLIATFKLRSSTVRSRISSRTPARSTNTRRPPEFTITSVTVGSSSRCSIGFTNGRMRAKLLTRRPGRHGRSSWSGRPDIAASDSSTWVAWGSSRRTAERWLGRSAIH